MDLLTRWLLGHRAMVVALLMGFVAAGIMAWRDLPIEAFPDVTNINVQVITLWPGHATEEVERMVTIPVENQMNGLPDRASLRSVSLFGLSQITVTFEDGVDGFAVRSQVAQQLAQVNLPPGANASISPDSTPVGEIYRYTLRAAPGFPPTELKAIEDFTVERQFRTVPGVVDVSGFGGPTRQYQVLVDPQKLQAHAISLNQVLTALQNGNSNAGGAYIERGPQLTIVRGIGLVNDLHDIENIVVVANNGSPVTVGDLGRVVIGNQLRLGRVGITLPESGKSFAASDDDDAVQGIVLLRKGANATQVLAAIHAKVDEINREHLPPGVKLVPHYDRTDLVERSMHTVAHNMGEGIALVIVVLATFLGVHHVRSALVVALTIPLSLLGAFMLLHRLHVPANLISLGAIDFGIIVDSAVVVMENIIRLREERVGQGIPLGRTIVDGVAGVGRPILFSKAILLTAFIPLFTLQRVEGRIFQPMALTLSFALAAGTLLAVTVVPILASWFMGDERAADRAGATGDASSTAHEALAVRWLRFMYAPVIAAALRLRLLVIVVALMLVIAAGWLASRQGSEFLPKLEEDSLWIRATMPASIAPTEASRLVRRMRGILSAFPETRTVVSQTGRPDDGTDVNGWNVAEISVDLRPLDTWTTAHDRAGLTAAMQAKLAEMPGVDFDFSQYIEDNVNEAVSGIKGELGIKIFGPDPATLQDLGDRIAAALANVPGAGGVGAEQLMGQPEVQIEIDRKAIARYGMAVADVQAVISSAFGGAVATQVLEGERTFDLAVLLDPLTVADVDAIRRVPVQGPGGQKLILADLARIGVRIGSGRIYREDNQRRIAVHFTPIDRDLGSLVADAERTVAMTVPMPPGYHLVWTGSFENEQRAMARLAVIVPLTLLGVLFLLFTAFDSFALALLVLANIPLAAVGGVLALWLAGLPMSVSALVGFIALFGVSVQNGVLLIERIRELIIGGTDARTAIRDGAMSRLRPVVMTSLMAALGLLPAALSTAVGAETARPFALVIVGGLASATVLTLVVLPAACTWLRMGPGPGRTGGLRSGGWSLDRGHRGIGDSFTAS